MEIISIDVIVDKVNRAFAEGNFYIMGEQKWSRKLAFEILEKEKNGEKEGENGIFLISCKNGEIIEKQELLKNCLRIYFFDETKQINCYRTESGKDQFYFSEIGFKEGEKLELTNLKDKSSERSNYRFSFAQKIGAIPEFLKEKPISILISDDQNSPQWRFVPNSGGERDSQSSWE